MRVLEDVVGLRSIADEDRPNSLDTDDIDDEGHLKIVEYRNICFVLLLLIFVLCLLILL